MIQQRSVLCVRSGIRTETLKLLLRAVKLAGLQHGNDLHKDVRNNIRPDRI